MNIVCDLCRRNIPSAEPFMTVSYQLERSDAAGYVTVDEAESLLTACMDCAPPRTSVAARLADSLRTDEGGGR